MGVPADPPAPMSPIAHDYDADADEPDAPGGDDELSAEALYWQFLLLVNPGDEDAAQQQFHAFEEALQAQGVAAGEPHAFALLRQAIDWRAGFDLASDDVGTLLECLTELAARFDLRLDFGSDEPDDEEFLQETDAATLLARAHQSLREHGYSLWLWHPHGEPQEERCAGGMCLRREDEALEIVAAALGLALRPGSGF
jgi:hypothetical protein